MKDFIEVNHQYQTTAIVSADGINRRIKLGLGMREVAEIKAVALLTTSTSSQLLTCAVSKDPDEAGNIDDSSVQRQSNIIAIYAWVIGITASGAMTKMTSPLIIFPEPGIIVATDISVMYGASADIAATRWGASVYFIRRREKPGEREQLIMARR